MKRLSLILAMAILLNSCSAILGSRYQKVIINTDSKNTILVNGEEPKKKDGKYILKRDFTPKQITVQRKGYKDEHITIMQYKRHPLKYVSYLFYIPIVTFYIPVLDRSAKGWNHDKEITVGKKMLNVPKKDDNAKEIRLNNVEADIKPEKIKYRYFNNYRSFKNKEATSEAEVVEDAEKIEVENTIFSLKLNELLKEKGYIDTTQKVLKDSYLDNLFIDTKVTGYTVHLVNQYGYGLGISFMRMMYVDLETEWTVLDFYKKPIHSFKTKTTSGQFAINAITSEEVAHKAIKDALEIGLIKFLKNKEVDRLLHDKSQQKIEANYEDINISIPTKPVSKLSEAPNASVTIKNDRGHGSGFIISSDGYIITNYHVVSGSKKLTVILNDETQYEAKLVRESKIKDLAILKIEASNLVPFKISTNKEIEIASEVYVIGTPTAEDLSQTISKGIISAIRKQSNSKLIQTDASINAGNSGGAILNKQGEVIGIVSSKLKGFGIEGVAFGIPVEELFEGLKIVIK